MDWFLQLPAEVQIPIVGLGGSLIAILGILVNAKFARPNPDKEHEYKRPPMEIKLSPEDRELFVSFRETIRDHRHAIEDHREELIRHPPGQPAPGRRGG